jgi:HD-GYP domain-containing protein (c-di-GMP phosphodiesterase class II)
MISATNTSLPSRLPFPEILQMSPRQQKAKNDLLRAMEHIVEDLHGHVHRVADLAIALGRTLEVDEDDIARLGLVGVLHDVGKIHVDPAILSKPGPLDPWELEHMRRHPELGFAMTVDRFDRRVSEAILYHHERYDGRGYPFGLAGMEIPLLARIVLVADAFDAMVSHRSYQPALPVEVAVEEINLHAGTQFDPMVVEAFNHVCEAGQLPPAAKTSLVTP